MARIDTENAVKGLQEFIDNSDCSHGDPELFVEEARKAIKGLGLLDGEMHPDISSKDLIEIMDTVYKARSLIRFKISGMDVDTDWLYKFANDSLKDVPALDVDKDLKVGERSLIERIAEALFVQAVRKLPRKEASTVNKLMITGPKKYIQILERIAKLCVMANIDFGVDITNNELESVLIDQATENGLEQLAKEEFGYYSDYHARVGALGHPCVKKRSNTDHHPDLLKKHRAPFLRQFFDGEKKSSLIQHDEEFDNMPLSNYLTLILRAYNQPWKEISEAQDILAKKFKRAKKIQICKSNGTDLDMQFGEYDFMGDNETGVAGSCIRSAPSRKFTNGTLVAKGKFKFENYPIIRDIILVFEGGKVVDFRARIGEDALREIITGDDNNRCSSIGARFIGEFILGTNPFLQNNLPNDLLSQHIGGNFTIVLGESHKNQQIGDKNFKINNLNKSGKGVHFHIPVNLAKKRGIVKLNGKIVRKNGLWVDKDGNPDPELAVLNYGWGALPENKRPKWHATTPYAKEGAEHRSSWIRNSLVLAGLISGLKVDHADLIGGRNTVNKLINFCRGKDIKKLILEGDKGTIDRFMDFITSDDGIEIVGKILFEILLKAVASGNNMDGDICKSAYKIKHFIDERFPDSRYPAPAKGVEKTSQANYVTLKETLFGSGNAMKFIEICKLMCGGFGKISEIISEESSAGDGTCESAEASSEPVASGPVASGPAVIESVEQQDDIEAGSRALAEFIFNHKNDGLLNYQLRCRNKTQMDAFGIISGKNGIAKLRKILQCVIGSDPKLETKEGQWASESKMMLGLMPDTLERNEAFDANCEVIFSSFLQKEGVKMLVKACEKSLELK